MQEPPGLGAARASVFWTLVPVLSAEAHLPSGVFAKVPSIPCPAVCGRPAPPSAAPGKVRGRSGELGARLWCLRHLVPGGRQLWSRGEASLSCVSRALVVPPPTPAPRVPPPSPDPRAGWDPRRVTCLLKHRPSPLGGGLCTKHVHFERKRVGRAPCRARANPKKPQLQTLSWVARPRLKDGSCFLKAHSAWAGRGEWLGDSRCTCTLQNTWL